MDSQRIVGIATQVRAQARRLDEVEQSGSSGARLLAQAWEGPDVQALLARWDGVRGDLEGAAESLRAAADEMVRQSESQDEASGGSGGAGGGGAVGARGRDVGPSSDRSALWTGAPDGLSVVPAGLGMTGPIDLGPGASRWMQHEMTGRRAEVEAADPPTAAERRSREAANAPRGSAGVGLGGLSYRDGQWTVEGKIPIDVDPRVKGTYEVEVGKEEWKARAGVEVGGGVDTGLTMPKGGPFFEFDAEGKVTTTVGVSVPAGTVDPNALNPLAPEDAPVGTVWDVEATAEARAEGALGTRNVGMSGGYETVVYDKTSIEVIEDDKVLITRGDGQTVDNEAGLRVQKGVKLDLGAGSQSEAGAMESVVVDVSTPEGKAAYDRFLATGEWPQESGDGAVSGTTVLETADWEETRNAGVGLGGASADSESVVFRHNKTTETLPDGSSQVVRIASASDGSQVEHNQHLDPQGNPTPGGTYTYTLDITDPVYAERVAQNWGIAVEPGETVEITVTEAEMKAMHEANTGAGPVEGAPADPNPATAGDEGTYSIDLVQTQGDGTVDELQRAWAEVEPGTGDGTTSAPGSARVVTEG